MINTENKFILVLMLNFMTDSVSVVEMLRRGKNQWLVTAGNRA